MNDHAHNSIRRLIEVFGDECHGIVIHDGEQDACGKPPVAIIDGHGTEDECYWPACAYHANRWERGRCVSLQTILAELEPQP